MKGHNLVSGAITNPKSITIPRLMACRRDEAVSEIPHVFSVMNGFTDGNISVVSTENLRRIVGGVFPSIIYRMFTHENFVGIIRDITTEEERCAILHIYLKCLQKELDTIDEEIVVD